MSPALPVLLTSLALAARGADEERRVEVFLDLGAVVTAVWWTEEDGSPGFGWGPRPAVSLGLDWRGDWHRVRVQLDGTWTASAVGPDAWIPFFVGVTGTLAFGGQRVYVGPFAQVGIAGASAGGALLVELPTRPWKTRRLVLRTGPMAPASYHTWLAYEIGW